MSTVISVIGFILVIMGFFCLYGAKTDHGWRIGMVLGGLCQIGAGFAANMTGSWWPLIVGFVLGWVLRLVGADPGYRPAGSERQIPEEIAEEWIAELAQGGRKGQREENEKIDQ